jgi:hypothetical protein
MRLEKLRRELMAFADLSPVILVHRHLGPRLRIQIRKPPDGGRGGRRGNIALLAVTPAIHQLLDISHGYFASLAVAAGFGELGAGT